MGGGAGLVHVFAGTAVALLVAPVLLLTAEVLPPGLVAAPPELALPPAEHAASPAVTHAITAVAAVTLIGVLIVWPARQAMYFWTRAPRFGNAASMFLAAPPRTALYALTTAARSESRLIRSVTDSRASATSSPRLAR